MTHSYVLGRVFGAAAGAVALAATSAACADPEPVPVAPPASAGTAVPSEKPPVAAAATPTARVSKTPAKSPTKSPAKAEPKENLDRFVALVRAKLPDAVIDRRDEELAGMGELTCDWLAAGRKEATVLAEIRDQGLTAPDARVLLRLARNAACPT